jgi:WD40 repeat protein/energy-coupling factor transporter ATP-binding protein EcfA2
MTGAGVTSRKGVSGLWSLALMRDRHGELLQARRANGDSLAFQAEVKEFIGRTQASGALLDHDDDRRTAQGLLNYWANSLQRMSGSDADQPDAILAEFDPSRVPTLPESDCPYVGLAAFEAEQRHLFYGRGKLIEQLVERLKECRFLAVVGPSGSGKSSLVRAGLIPALQEGRLPGSAGWRYYPPIVPGSQPLLNLARAVRPNDVETAREALLKSPNALSELIDRAGSEPALLFVDQFEEMLTLCRQEDHRRALMENLLTLVADEAKHTVVLTMRRDFKNDLEGILVGQPALQHVFELAWAPVEPLSPGELREAIIRPAERVGLKFEPSVVDLLVRDLVGPGSELPLLQFALLKLWHKRLGDRISVKDYVEIGGGLRALPDSANAAFEALSEEDKRTARHLLLRLVHVGEGEEATRNRVQRGELVQQLKEDPDRVRRVLDQLMAAGALRASEGETWAEGQIEVTHEALLRRWRRLAEWIDDERVALRQRGRLTAAARQWAEHGRGADTLWGAALTEEARQYKDLSPLEAEFLAASGKALERAEQRRQRWERRFRRRTHMAIASLVVSIVLLGVLFALAFRGSLSAYSGKLALKANSLLVNDQRVIESLLVGLEAHLTADTPDSRKSLLNSVVVAREAARLRRIDAFGSFGAAVTSVAFRPDGKAVAVAVGIPDQVIVVWDLAEKRELARLPALGAPVYSLAFTPDGNTLASGSGDNGVVLWDLRRRQRSEEFRDHSAPVLSLAFSPSGRFLVSGGADNRVIVRDSGSATGKPVILDQKRPVVSVACADEGRTVKSIDQGNSILEWDVQVGRARERKSTALGETASIAAGFSADGFSLVTVDSKGTMTFADLRPGRPSLGRLVTNNSTSGVVSIAFSADGRTLASGTKEGQVILWQVTPPESLRSTRIEGKQDNKDELVAIAVGGHGESLALATCASLTQGKGDCSQGQIRLWSITDAVGSKIVPGRFDAITSVAFSGDGRILASGDKNGTIIILRGVGTTPEPRREERHSGAGPVLGLAFSPDGMTLASGHGDGAIILHSIGTPDASSPDRGGAEKLASLAGRTAAILSVAFSTDGTILAAGGSDKAIGFWDVATHEPIGELPHRHKHDISSLAFSPVGERNSILASADVDGTIILWDWKSRDRSGRGAGTSRGVTGDPLIWQALAGHADRVLGLAFSADGKVMLSGSRDRAWITREVDVIDPKFQSWHGLVCKLARRNLSAPEWNQHIVIGKHLETCTEAQFQTVEVDTRWGVPLRRLWDRGMGWSPGPVSPGQPG